jgi:hypothetical protein
MERAFGKQVFSAFRDIINARSRQNKGEFVDFRKETFESLRRKIEEALPASMTRSYFSITNSPETNLLVATGDLIPVTITEVTKLNEKITTVEEKLGWEFINNTSHVRDCIIKWARKMKPDTAGNKWSDADIQNFKEHWQKVVVYNNGPAIEKNAINSFEDLRLAMWDFICSMRRAEVEYALYHPYAARRNEYMHGAEGTQTKVSDETKKRKNSSDDNPSTQKYKKSNSDLPM